MNKPLKFVVAAHIVQDLGLNLYTSLPKVLVEFIANAYDADSQMARIILNKDEIEQARSELRDCWQLECTQAIRTRASVAPLDERTLPSNVRIVVEDFGHGMGRSDLQEKFLVAGRRRRVVESTTHTKGGRLLMGRKGLGKLAGFGVAHKVIVETRRAGETHGTRIILDYRKILEARDTTEIPIEEEVCEAGMGFESSGTRIILSDLLYEPMKSRLATIKNNVGDHFAQISPDDFRIELNGESVEPTKRTLVYGWPEPERPVHELVTKTLPGENGIEHSFSYRLRFTEDRASLPAKERGVRVYTHNRLAAAPSLMDADTNMHGFRMTDYLDGIVCADFIDDQGVDYIATDRQALRWESPLLTPLYDFLSKEIKEACKHRQAARDNENESQVKTDDYTRDQVERAELTKSQEKAAYKMAGALSALHKKGINDDAYKTQFAQVMHGFGQGEILTALSRLAEDSSPRLDHVVREITRLTAEELDGFYRFVKGRINGIEALNKIVMDVNFSNGNNEEELHHLFNRCPWLIDPTFFEFLTSNRTEKSMFREIEKELQVAAFVPNSYDNSTASEQEPGGKNRRPDLVFLLGNAALARLVIVELKAPNTPLYGEHYRQLQGYVDHTEQWLKSNSKTAQVEGILIGTMADIKSKATDVRWLEKEVSRTMNQGQCRVFTLSTILDRARRAHMDFLNDKPL